MVVGQLGAMLGQKLQKKVVSMSKHNRSRALRARATDNDDASYYSDAEADVIPRKAPGAQYQH